MRASGVQIPSLWKIALAVLLASLLILDRQSVFSAAPRNMTLLEGRASTSLSVEYTIGKKAPAELLPVALPESMWASPPNLWWDGAAQHSLSVSNSVLIIDSQECETLLSTIRLPWQAPARFRRARHTTDTWTMPEFGLATSAHRTYRDSIVVSGIPLDLRTRELIEKGVVLAAMIDKDDKVSLAGVSYRLTE